MCALPRRCLSFCDTRIGKIVPQALRRREGEIGRDVDREGEEGGPGPPCECTFFLRLFFVPLSFLFIGRPGGGVLFGFFFR